MMCNRNHSRGGFTLAELLIVMGAIVILIGMVSGGMMMVMRFQLKTDTVRLVDQLTEAITLYLDKEPIGAPGMDDWDQITPNTGMLDYLYKIPKNPYFEPASTYWSTGNINKTLGADFLLDAWGNALEYEKWTLDANARLVTRSSPSGTSNNYGKWSYRSGAFRSGSSLEDGNVIRSRGPNQIAGSDKDDLVWLYTKAGGWRRYK